MRTCPTCAVDWKEEDYGRSFYCRPCMAKRARDRRHAHPEKYRDEWKKVPKEKRTEQFSRWYRRKSAERRKVERKEKYDKNRDQELEVARAYKAANREELNRRDAERRRNNPELNRFYRSERRAAEKQATPSWVNRSAMRAIYKEAVRLSELTGIPHHVDHIVPLQSPWVCGLHCEANLQILPYYENQSKSNRVWPDMPDLTGCSPLQMAV